MLLSLRGRGAGPSSGRLTPPTTCVWGPCHRFRGARAVPQRSQPCATLFCLRNTSSFSGASHCSTCSMRINLFNPHKNAAAQLVTLTTPFSTGETKDLEKHPA